jgi:hypothetical protein
MVLTLDCVVLNLNNPNEKGETWVDFYFLGGSFSFYVEASDLVLLRPHLGKSIRCEFQVRNFVSVKNDKSYSFFKPCKLISVNK